jgi:hypothetical protein
MAERLEALLPADGLAALVRRLEQLRDTRRKVHEEKMTYSTDDSGTVVEVGVAHTYVRRS